MKRENLLRRWPAGSRLAMWIAAALVSPAALAGPQAGGALSAAAAEPVQACAYDGGVLSFAPGDLAFGAARSGAEVVAQILRYVGLPANFEVVASPKVPNAAAVILVGPDRLPRRVIAYNEKFMREIREATANSDWTPISIMAHEIGHHLSGHTILPGGSRPPTELEADRFSGFVLFKMGAGLDDATRAIRTLASERDGPTHPARSRRVKAISEGWRDACLQQRDDCSDGVAATAAASTPTKAEPAPRPGLAQASPRPDRLPVPDRQAVPGKQGRFVIDELGVLDPATREAFEQRMRELAGKHQVEIVSILAKDLHGLSADAYALAMLRQLRVGKLDVGNGAVLVAAPGSGSVGVAFGPGVRLELADYVDLEKKRLAGFLEHGMPRCTPRCGPGETGMFLAAAEHVAEDTANWDWQIRFQSLPELLASHAKVQQARRDGQKIPPREDPTWRKIARVEGTLVSRDARQSGLGRWVNGVRVGKGSVPLHVRTDDGRDLVVYADPAVEALMPAPMEVGSRHAWTVRTASLSENPRDALGFDLLSFDLLR